MPAKVCYTRFSSLGLIWRPIVTLSLRYFVVFVVFAAAAWPLCSASLANIRILSRLRAWWLCQWR